MLGEFETAGLPGDYPIGGCVRVSGELIADLVSLCRAGLPHEACGLGGGRAGEIVQLYPLANASASPERYTVEPSEQLEAYRAMAADGLECVAVYHSHPSTPARPSPTDIAEAYDPDVVYVIVSFASEPPSVRAFMIRDGRVTELTVETEALAEPNAAQ